MGGSGMIGPEVIERLFALRATPPFHRLDGTELLLIAQHARPRAYAPGRTVIAAGTIAEALFIRIGGGVRLGDAEALPVFDAAGLLFGLATPSDFVAGPEGLEALVIAKPHVFTIALECPEFVVGLRGLMEAART